MTNFFQREEAKASLTSNCPDAQNARIPDDL